MISLETYFGSHEEKPDEAVQANALDLLSRVNAMLAKIALPEAHTPMVNSGWRPAAYNATVKGAAPKSKHITGQAVDIRDDEGALDDYLVSHTGLLIEHGLYMEHPLSTKGWTHLQSVRPGSGNLVFYP